MERLYKLLKLAGTATAAAILMAAPQATAAPESQDPIKITLNDWSGQLISSKIMGSVLKNAGYNVEYVQADYLAQLTGMQSGDLDVAMEIWATTGREALEAAVKTGKVVNLGETGMVAKEEWWVPDYTFEVCPGLPDWKALNKCAAKFATTETAPKGRYLGGPVTWGGFDEERIANLPLDFTVVHAGTDAALYAELDAAYAKKEPIVLWVYQPHWVPIKYKGHFIEFPPYTKECYDSKQYNCAKPGGPVWKAAWVGVDKKWPGAGKVIRNFKISNEEMGELVKKVDVDGKDLDGVVADWIKANEATWKKWIQ
ncbi:ABC transporter substrate-binding protein [Hyphomicrobium sp.]|uniref:ABC transporter substrate-binding protein n=1 Tax=Hyphomicrobium sp. TaxID=82 RepID=UPI001E1671A4|nr:ABC transporter substrate-binding protein [Hyphomicrobium sp.]MBY0558854.1 ABC transporter substrate-binding protein [Hyphomicrobium sp.]